MTSFLKKYSMTLVGLVAGAAGGFLYSTFVGCSTGHCPLTSNPAISTLYWAFFGALVMNSFEKSKGSKPKNIQRSI